MDTEQSGHLVTAAAQRIFGELADPQAIIRDPGGAWKARLWGALEESGLPAAWAPEGLGGHALSLEEGFAVVRAAGRAALAVPLVETMLASWVLGRAGLRMPRGAIGVIPAGTRDRVTIDDAGRVSARCARVPFARDVAHLVAVCDAGRGARVALVAAGDCGIASGLSLAGDACDAVTMHEVPAVAWAEVAGLDADTFCMLGATARALQIAGALETALETSVRYAGERVAFGRPIAKFQAIQHALARMGGEVAAAVAVAESAADALASLAPGSDGLLLEVASAKLRCGEAAETAAAIAHQVHGAIGSSDEHVLHRYTLRALAWREDFGHESYWSRRLGRLIAGGSGEDLWKLLATR
jgi:alkylation response protein AidB-like acyl-CoA dehydrogenase